MLFTERLAIISCVVMMIIGLCIIGFAKKLGSIMFENRGQLDNSLSSIFQIKEDIIGRFTGTSWKNSTYTWLFRVFGLLWIGFAVFIIIQIF